MVWPTDSVALPEPKVGPKAVAAPESDDAGCNVARTRCPQASVALGVREFVETREVRDAPPQQRLEQRDRLGLGDRTVAVEPPAGRDLGRAGQGGREQLGARPIESGVA